MNCGCGSVYTLTPGDRLYLSAMVKSLQRRVSVLEDTTIDLPQWVLQPNPPVYNVNQIIGAVASSDLADVAFSGDFNDLLNVPPPPVIPAQVNTDWNATFGPAELLNKPQLFSGDYEDLVGKPSIPRVFIGDTPPPNPQIDDVWIS